MSVFPKVGDTFKTSMRGGTRKVRVLAVHSFGTMDVEVIRSGKCFRISGLDFILEHDPLNLLQEANQ